eukprot:3005051-Amphidinium_carterae.2
MKQHKFRNEVIPKFVRFTVISTGSNGDKHMHVRTYVLFVWAQHSYYLPCSLVSLKPRCTLLTFGQFGVICLKTSACDPKKRRRVGA